MIPENSQEEGWVLGSNESGLFQIKRTVPQDGSEPRFRSDEEAYSFVVTKMMELRKKVHTFESALKAHQQNSFAVNQFPDFPNGFVSWYETFYQLAAMIHGHLINQDEYRAYDDIILSTHDQGGTMAMVELAKSWTDEFETQSKGINWGDVDETGRYREYFDELEEFFQLKIQQRINRFEYQPIHHYPGENWDGPRNEPIPNLWPEFDVPQAEGYEPPYRVAYDPAMAERVTMDGQTITDIIGDITVVNGSTTVVPNEHPDE